MYSFVIEDGAGIKIILFSHKHYTNANFDALIKEGQSILNDKSMVARYLCAKYGFTSYIDRGVLHDDY